MKSLTIEKSLEIYIYKISMKKYESVVLTMLLA